MTTSKKILKQLASSGTFAIITVMQTLAVIFDVVLAVLAGLVGSEMIFSNSEGMTSVFGYMGYYYMNNEILETLALFLPLVFVITALLLSVPEIIKTIAFWIIRKNARKENTPLKTTSFTILLTINIIFFVIFCISALVSLVTLTVQSASIGIILLAGFAGRGAFFGLFALIISVIVTVTVYVATFITYLKIFKSINVARNIIKTEKSAKKPSRFLACMCCVEGALFVAAAVFAFVLVLPVGGMLKIMPLVLCIVLFLYFVCLAISAFACAALISKARKRLIELENTAQIFVSAEGKIFENEDN